MTQDEIIRMAREAGFRAAFDGEHDMVADFDHMHRFATLVAAEKDKQIATLQCDMEVMYSREDVDYLIGLEREACAKVCEELINEETCYVWIPDARGAVNNCAAAIRARGDNATC